MKTRFLFLLISMLFTYGAIANPAFLDSIKPLKIGDKVPDVFLEKMINYTSAKAKLSDFRGKLIILDFWSRGCKVCISAFPKMEQLQNEFPDVLQIIAVTRETEKDFEILRKTSPIVKSTKLTMLLEDNTFTRLFPHTSEPYLVWIGSDGLVKFFTEGYNASASNIYNLLKGNIPNLYNLPPQYYDFDSRTSILEEGNGRQIQNIRYYSLITQLGVNRGSLTNLRDTNGKTVGYRYINLPITHLFAKAFQPIDLDKIVVELPNPDNYYQPIDNKDGKMDIWVKNNYSYEIKIDAPLEKIQKIMQKDLQLFFDIEAVKEKRKVPCLIVRRTTNEDKLKTASDVKTPYKEGSQSSYFLRNFPFVDFIGSLTISNLSIHRNKAFPVIDETNYTGNVDMEINVPFSDFYSLNMEIKKYGIEIIKSEREIEMLILKPSVK